MDTKIFDEFAKKLGEQLPTGVQQFQVEIEKQAKATMQSMLGKLDVVTREEFDTQTKVLLRTREKLEALEAKVAELEKQQNN